MTLAWLAEELVAGGFAGVLAENTMVYARLTPADGEFTACLLGDRWELALCRAMRATDRQRADWARHHPDAPLDIWRGETRLRMVASPGDQAALTRWAALAEAFMVATLRWRKGQRDGDEGM